MVVLGVGWVIAAVSWATGAEISNVQINSGVLGRYEKLEVTFDLARSYSDPFDPIEIDASVIFTRPDLSTVTVPAFFLIPYTVEGSNPESYTHPGPGIWTARLAPDRVGIWSFAIQIIDSEGTALLTHAGTFECVSGSRKGFLRVHPLDSSFLAYDDGSSRINIGHNVCWVKGGLAGWQHYFAFMSNAGENWSRLWMCTYGSPGGLALEGVVTDSSGYFNGAGKFSMQVAQRLDRVVELAEQYGIAFQLVLQHHGQFSTSTDANWTVNPYNDDNASSGGFLDGPEKFFTDPAAIRLAKNKYRYIVSRWGYSPAILAWELWNEVQYTNGWAADATHVVNWHREISDYIRGVDPFDHLITTSSHQSGFDAIWKLPAIDLIQVHTYSGPRVGMFEDLAFQLAGYKKPVVFGEFGLGTLAGVFPPENNPDQFAEPYRSQIYEALDLHNGIWSAFHLKSSGHLWWWDSYIDKLDLYNQFLPLSRYGGHDDLAGIPLRQADRVVSGNEAIRATPGLSDFWAVSTQTNFTLVNGRFPGLEKLSQWLHGSSKSTIRSDPTFNLTFPEAGNLVIHVVQVSNWGSNGLTVMVDNQQVHSATYTNGAGNFDIAVPLPAGPHKVQVKNTGQDWFQIGSYQFVPEHIGLLDSIGLIGSDHAWLWIFDTFSQLGRTPNPPFENEHITVHGLSDGDYFVDAYATRPPGGLIASNSISSEMGILQAPLPRFSRDIAVKIAPACFVDMPYLATLGEQWLDSGDDLPADLNDDGFVNALDLAELARLWLSRCPSNRP